MKKIFSSKIFWGCFAGTLAVIAVVIVGILLRPSNNVKADAQPTSSSTTTTSTTTTTTTRPLLSQPAPGNIPLLGAGQSLGSGSSSETVGLIEQRLVDLKFDPGPVDNKFDSKTVYAIHALQKIKGLPVTGRVGDTEIQTLNSYQYDVPMIVDGDANRLEVSLDKQYAIYYQNYQVRLVTTVSTGNGKNYCYVNKQGRRTCSKANTPTGNFKFERQVKGWRDGDLGLMYAPMYFKGGIAVHGYKSVPTAPASHGCVRIPMHIAEYFQSLASIGESVHVVSATEVPYVGNSVGEVVTTKPPTTTAAPTTTAPTTTTPSTTTTLPTTTTT